jgi:hypothetical protein
VIWCSTVSLKTFVPRKLRRVFFVFRDAKWLVPACRCFALPLAVSRNRFFVPLCVFCFGMEVARLLAIIRFVAARPAAVSGSESLAV